MGQRTVAAALCSSRPSEVEGSRRECRPCLFYECRLAQHCDLRWHKPCKSVFLIGGYSVRLELLPADPVTISL